VATVYFRRPHGRRRATEHSAANPVSSTGASGRCKISLSEGATAIFHVGAYK
jgi:hypothetical protein